VIWLRVLLRVRAKAFEFGHALGDGMLTEKEEAQDRHWHSREWPLSART
jgi:hypothetical protein